MMVREFRQALFFSRLAFPKEPIKITLPDGNVKEGISFVTTPLDVAKMLSNSLAKSVVVARVRFSKRVATLDDGLVNPSDFGSDEEGKQKGWEMYDSFRPLEGDCEIQLLKFEDLEGKMVFWHSSAHILGEAMERDFGVHLCHGPPTEDGFFYDCFCGSDVCIFIKLSLTMWIQIFKADQYKDLEAAATKVVSEKQTFHRLILSKEEALQLFAYNPFKVQLIQTKIAEGGKVTAYKCGDLVDICTGPHVPSTDRVKAFKVMKNSSAYWLGQATNDSLQRIYGVTFPSKEEMKEHLKNIELAEKNDHRNIGK